MPIEKRKRPAVDEDEAESGEADEDPVETSQQDADSQQDELEEQHDSDSSAPSRSMYVFSYVVRIRDTCVAAVARQEQLTALLCSALHGMTPAHRYPRGTIKKVRVFNFMVRRKSVVHTCAAHRDIVCRPHCRCMCL